MDLKIVSIDKPSDVNVILGQTHFIKSVEDIYELQGYYDKEIENLKEALEKKRRMMR